MSNTEAAPAQAAGGAGLDEVAATPVRELLLGRDVVLGGPRAMSVTRTLPHRDRRMVGAWCFVDHYGPEEIGDAGGMRVPPHPHAGLQTVSWLIRGEILHRDSLGSEQLIRPGQLNLMTSGAGISHSEESPARRSPVLHGAQLWVALPDESRAVAPAFAHHDDLPVVARRGLTATVLMGTLGTATSPARAYTPLVGAEVEVREPGGALPLRPDWEYAVLAFGGPVVVDEGEPVPAGALVYLGRGRAQLRLTGSGRVLLLGGEPFDEQIVMWWNFVGRSHEDIVAARAAWMDDDAFGTVRGFDGEPLAAPALPATRLRPRGRSR